jgi:Lrp/AsnC family transcriptional regulator, leucine-responsive regulatory protein
MGHHFVLDELPEVLACHYISGTRTFELHLMATDLQMVFSIKTLHELNAQDIQTGCLPSELKTSLVVPLALFRLTLRGTAC